MKLAYRNRFWFTVFHPRAVWGLFLAIWKLEMAKHREGFWSDGVKATNLQNEANRRAKTKPKRKLA